MDGKLAGKVALVTGSRQGLGLVFAKALANAGAEVILTSRDARQAEQAASDISRETSRNCRACALDVLDEKSVEAAAEFIAKATGRLDILVNNAAVGRGSTPLQDASLDEWNLTIGTNLTGTFLCMKHFGRLMIRQRSGKIINLTSLAARAVFDGAATGVGHAALVLHVGSALAVQACPGATGLAGGHELETAVVVEGVDRRVDPPEADGFHHQIGVWHGLVAAVLAPGGHPRAAGGVVVGGEPGAPGSQVGRVVDGEVELPGGRKVGRARGDLWSRHRLSRR